MKESSGSSRFFPQQFFLICKRRKNHPRISPLICEQRCQRIKGCREYFDYLQPAMFAKYEKREAKGKEHSTGVEPDPRDSRSSRKRRP